MAGNDHVLKLLVDHGPQIHRLLVRLTLSEHVAEDLLQDLFLKLLTKVDVADIDHAPAFLRKAAIHAAFDWRRRHQLRKYQPLSEVSSSNEPKAGERMEIQEQVEKVLDALEQLPCTHRDVVVMRYFDHATFEDIGEVLGKSPHHIRSILHKAMNRLRKMLNVPSGSNDK